VATPGVSIPAELRKRILFTLGILAIYRFGVHVPVPGVDAKVMLAFFQSQSGGIFGLFNTFTGGALERFSVFALGIMPYISASIIFQLLQTAVPYLEQLKKEGGPGQKKINQYTRYGTLLLALIQGYAMTKFLMNANHQGQPLVVVRSFGPGLSFQLVTLLTLMAGTCFVMWLGEQITEFGIGNGSSLIIFAGIAAGLPGGAIRLWKMVQAGEMSGLIALAMILGMVAVIGIIVFLEVGQRRIPIQYSQRATSREGMAQQQSSHLPLKINFSNVIPPIFASSLLMFPATVAQFVDNPTLHSLANSMRQDHILYNLVFIGLIVFFSFFYTEIVFNPVEVADNLKKYGGFIPGIRAGKSTSDYIKRVLDRLTVAGAVYLSAICVLPQLLSQQLHTPFYFGGTSLMILVGVALDTSQQIQSHLITARYEGMLKGVKLKNRRVQY
jgi:preprotein translocase subunit SecY